MYSEDQFKEDWVKFYEFSKSIFEDLGVFKWTERIYYKSKFKGREYIKYEYFKGGVESLKLLFWYLVEMYCFSVAAEKIAKEYVVKKENEKGNYWTLNIRNYHVYDFIPRYISFLDNAAYFVASLTEWELVKGTFLEVKGTMYYGEFFRILKDSIVNNNTVGFLNQKDREIFLKFLKSIDIQTIDQKLRSFASTYRQDITHLILPEIDFYHQLMKPKFKKIEGKKTFELDFLGLLGEAKYKFKDIENFAIKVIQIIDDSFPILFETDIMKSLMKDKDDKTNSSQIIWKF